MSELLVRQQQFSLMLGQFILWLYDQGYKVTGGEWWRTPQQVQWNVEHGTGISASLHAQRLAADLNIFKPDGTLCETVEDYRPAGEEWERRGGSWGGRFLTPDADHFSLSFKGVR